MINAEEYLVAVAAYIKRDGYVKSAYQDPTWEKALIRCEKPIASDNIPLTRDDRELAKESVRYFLDPIRSDQIATNEYMSKIKALLTDAFKYEKPLQKRDLPLLASTIQSYLKKQEFERKKKEAQDQQRKDARNSNYIGNIGDKITVQVAKMSYKFINTIYGESVLYKFTDPSGNIFIWFTTKDIPDTVQEITGTVKEHKEYNNVRQTVLTRCKFR